MFGKINGVHLLTRIVSYNNFASPIDICPKSIITCKLQSQNIRYKLCLEYNGYQSHNNELVVILMNPSKADMSISDDTINNVIKHLRGGYKYLTIFNLSPFYGIEPKYLNVSQLNAIHQIENLKYITEYIKKNNISDVLFAWGKCKISLNKEDKKLPNYQQLKDNKPIIENFFYEQKQKLLNKLSIKTGVTFYSYGKLLLDSSPIHFSPKNNRLLNGNSIIARIISNVNGKYILV